MGERVEDYLNFGVPYVWILDPHKREAWRCTRDGMLKTVELRTENPDTAIALAELFD